MNLLNLLILSHLIIIKYQSLTLKHCFISSNDDASKLEENKYEDTDNRYIENENKNRDQFQRE